MRADAVIILGKELRHYPERAQRELRARTAAASVALRAWGAQSVVSLEAPLVGQEAGSVIVARYLDELGVPEDRRVMAQRTRSTREEAVESARESEARGWERVLALTSAYHVPRTRRVFSDVLPESRFAVHVPEALLRHARPLERRWILEGVPDSEAMRVECTMEAVWSAFERALSPLPSTWRWEAEMAAATLLRTAGDRREMLRRARALRSSPPR